MPLRGLIYDIIHVNKPVPVNRPDWVESADMVFRDDTCFWRELEERDKRLYFPKNQKDFVLDANGDDGNGEVFRMGIEIMEELCEGRTFLIHFKSGGAPRKKKHSELPESFPERYHRFLQKANPTVSVYAKNSQELSILTTGFNREAYFTFTELKGPSVYLWESVSFYLFSENNAPSSAEKAQALADDHQAALAMYFHEWPDELHFVFAPENIDANEIWSIIERVCKKHDLVAARPPMDS